MNKLFVVVLLFVFSAASISVIPAQQHKPGTDYPAYGVHTSVWINPGRTTPETHRGALKDCPYCTRAANAGYLKVEELPGGGMDIRSPDGRPILEAQQVSFSLLNWALNWNGFYNQGMVSYPGSTDFQVQSALIRMTPQATWEQFGSVFQDDFHIRNLDNSVSGNGEVGYYRFVRSSSILTYPTSGSQSPDLWRVVITVKPDQVVDSVRSGISLRRHFVSWLVGLGGVYLLSEARNSGWVIGGVAAVSLSENIANYRRLEQTTALRFGVTVQFRHAATGDILTFKGATKELYPIVRSKYILFYNNVTGYVEWTTWDEALAEALREVKAGFDARWRRLNLTEGQKTLAKVRSEVETLRLEVEAAKQLRPELEEVARLEAEKAQLRRELDATTVPRPETVFPQPPK